MSLQLSYPILGKFYVLRFAVRNIKGGGIKMWCLRYAQCTSDSFTVLRSIADE